MAWQGRWHGWIGLLKWWIILHIVRDYQRSSESHTLVAFDVVGGGVRGGKWREKEESGKKMVELLSLFVMKLSAVAEGSATQDLAIKCQVPWPRQSIWGLWVPDMTQNCTDLPRNMYIRISVKDWSFVFFRYG